MNDLIELEFITADDFIKEHFRIRKERPSGFALEWRDSATGRFFVIDYKTFSDPGTKIVSLALRDHRDVLLFEVASGITGMGMARTLPITLSAVDDVTRKCSYVWLYFDTDGSRRDPHGYFDDWGSTFDFTSRGHYRLSTLPDHIDFDRTFQAFGEQVRSGNFSTPNLIV